MGRSCTPSGRSPEVALSRRIAVRDAIMKSRLVHRMWLSGPSTGAKMTVGIGTEVVGMAVRRGELLGAGRDRYPVVMESKRMSCARERLSAELPN